MVKLLHMWQCNQQESFSDYRYITFCIEKDKITFHDFHYNGVKYVTSEMGFQHFENNFIKEIKNNLRIRETLDLDNTLCEILTSESDTENVVRKYQDSMVAASKKSFKVRQLMQKNYQFQVSTLVDRRTYYNERKLTSCEGDTSEPYRTATCMKPGNSNTCRRQGSTKPL